MGARDGTEEFVGRSVAVGGAVGTGVVNGSVDGFLDALDNVGDNVTLLSSASPVKSKADSEGALGLGASGDCVAEALV